MIIPSAKSQHRLSSGFLRWKLPPGKRIIGTVADLEKSRWLTIAAGTLVAVGCFVLVLSGVAWLMPRFLRYSASPSFRVVPTLVYLLTTSATLLIVSLRRRRTNSLDAKTPRRHL